VAVSQLAAQSTKMLSTMTKALVKVTQLHPSLVVCRSAHKHFGRLARLVVAPEQPVDPPLIPLLNYPQSLLALEAVVVVEKPPLQSLFHRQARIQRLELHLTMLFLLVQVKASIGLSSLDPVPRVPSLKPNDLPSQLPHPTVANHFQLPLMSELGVLARCRPLWRLSLLLRRLDHLGSNPMLSRSAF